MRQLSSNARSNRGIIYAVLMTALAISAGILFWTRRPKAEEAPAAPRGNIHRAAPAYRNRAVWTPVKAAPDAGVKALAVSGIVYDIDGNTIEGATLSAATFEVSGNRLSTTGTAKSEVGGRFNLELPAGMYHLTATMEGYAPATAPVTSGDTISMIMQRAGAIVGHVYDENGKPVPHFSIDMMSIVPSDLAAPPPLWSRPVHDPEGAYRIDNAPGWAVVVRATATGYAPTFSPRVKVAPGQTQAVDIHLSRGCTLAGVAVDEKGEPVPGVAVNAESLMTSAAMGETSLDAMDDVWSADDGSFRLESVPMGHVVIRGYDGENAASTLELKIDSCAADVPVRLVMSRGGGLKGVARGADGKPLANAVLSLTKRSTGFVNVTTDAEGRFLFEKLPPGKARLELVYGAQRTLQIVTVKSGEVTEHDMALTAKGTGKLEGHITVNGKPLAGAKLLVASNLGEPGIAMYYPVTDSEGAYRVESLAEGSYMVSVLSTIRGVGVQINPDEVAVKDINVEPKASRKKAPEGEQAAP